ncbi:sperm axonemal maintenance protein CFAP97D1-like [Clavelina lepadiformis]|uniref:sperm axonemal maintenance protein CFAP97D1-like n=1 Tax=Clavelina lepadiformis TaxID=159417 RepID=UPI0040436131
MHRAYQPTTPANNKLLKKRWDQSRFDFHRRNVTQAMPVIDNRPPETYMHLHLKLKKLQMEEERLAIVERDNRILMEKMSYIMRTKSRVDNWNNYERKSLNKTKRQRELLRVTHENQAILKRLSSKLPHYNRFVWEDAWRVNQGYMANISKYPEDWDYSKNSLRYSSRPQSFHSQHKPSRRTASSKTKSGGQSQNEGKGH